MTGRNNVCAHARAACDVWSAGGTKTKFVWVSSGRRENVNTSRFLAKVKVFLSSGVTI